MIAGNMKLVEMVITGKGHIRNKTGRRKVPYCFYIINVMNGFVFDYGSPVIQMKRSIKGIIIEKHYSTAE
jgi:hypothetical protein